jgi:hypothetical protein
MKTLRDYHPTAHRLPEISNPKGGGPAQDLRSRSRPSVGEVHGTSSHMGEQGRVTAASSDLTGAFCTQYLNADGDTMLLGGTITGAHGGSAVVADEELYPVSDSPPLAASGDKLYLKCNVTAIVANGVMLPGLTLNTAALTKTLGSVHAFTTTALTGDLFIEVGRRTADAFLSSGACGLSSVGGCPGGYTIR